MPYAELDNDSGLIVVKTAYADRYLIRQCPGAAWHDETQRWRVPVSWAACITLRGLFGWDLEVGPLLEAWAVGEHGTRVAPATLLRDKLAIDAELGSNQDVAEITEEIDKAETETGQHLFAFQRVDVPFMVINRRAILANPMGCGKTASAIRTLQVLSMRDESPFPALVVCPNTVKETWAGELAKFAPEIRAQVIGGSMGKRRKQFEADADLWIINWEALRGHSRLAGYGAMALTDEEKRPKELNEMGFRTVIADEAHRAKDAHSKQTRAMWAVMRDAEFRFLMTGTPVVSNVGDLWALLHAIEPRAFPAKTRYLDRWARVELGFFGGSEILGLRPDTAAEFYKITDPLIRRIPKAAALPQLPPKLPVTYRYTEMTPQQARLYRQMELDMISTVENAYAAGEMLSAPNAISQLTRLLQFASASARLDEDGHVHLALPSAKVEDLVELLDEMGDEPLVVAAVSRQLIELAAARLDRAKVTYGLITGAVSTEDRQAYITAFQAGKLRVMLLTIDAGGTGITLTRASTIVFLQRHWAKHLNDQCEDRLHRIGQNQPVQVIDMITPGTVEWRKLQVLSEKEGRIEEVLRDRDTLAKLLGMI